MTVGTLSRREVRARVASCGLALRIPPVTVRLRSPLPFLAEQVHALYRDYPLADADDFADVDIRMPPLGGLRRLARRQVQFVVDGVTPFEPFPLAHAFPMFEWGLNWVVSHRLHEYLLLHAAVVERGGKALVLPAWPGSGKSTLAASLACRGWRLFSDEFGVVTLAATQVLPFVRPIALKNQSIEVIGSQDPNAFFGPVFPNTRKGTVAHFRVPAASVNRALESAPVAAIVFPDFELGVPLSVRPLPKPTAFLKLAGNAFNYEVVGERGFRAVASMVASCHCYLLRYGDLASAHSTIDDIMRTALSQ